MSVQVHLNALKQMRDVQNPVATTFDHFERVIAPCDKPARVSVNTVVRDIVKPVLSRLQKAIKATQLTRADVFHPVPQLTLALAFAHGRIAYRGSYTTPLVSQMSTRRIRKHTDEHIVVFGRALLC